MTASLTRRLPECLITAGLIAIAPLAASPAPPRQSTCRMLVINAEVSAGQEWKQPIGQGWVLRVLPVDAAKTPPGQPPYSGWDLVVDRDQPAGFPDALLLATPPYDSIHEREIATTFGVRAQDAIGWNPRSFRFITDPAAFRESRQLFLNVVRSGRSSPASTDPQASRLMALVRQSSPGQFRILDARLSPGISDAAPFAENWALQSARTPHTYQPAPGGKPTPLGTLDWIRFSITLWLPDSWNAPPLLHATRSPCSE
jgi:hypothetical protein